jgi:hypothetical protein
MVDTTVPMSSRHEVKGVWFVTTKAYVEEAHGLERLRAVAERLQPNVRKVLEEPMASEWYPEEHLQALLHALNDELAKGDPERFMREVRGASEKGLHRFFRALVRLSTPSFILRQAPTTWKVLRRGPGTMRSFPVADGTAIEYRRFPYYYDELYRLMSIATITALVEICAGGPVPVTITRWTSDELDMHVRHAR